ncbi:MAG: response regulator [Candidatus Thorarchaeota archaeon]
MASILIVEDDCSLRDLLTRILLIRGFEVIGSACNGLKAVNMFKNMILKPDIILMDYRMPVMNGIDATRKILEIDPLARVLFLSADTSIKDEAMEVGAVDFLGKPISCAEIIVFIEKHTSASEEEDFPFLPMIL